MSNDEIFSEAEAALRRGDGAGAERVLTQKWRDLSKAPGDAQHIMAMVRLSQNDSADAAHFMRGAVRAEPNSLRHHIALGHILSASGDDSGAADAYGAAVRIDKNWPGLYLALSLASYKAGRPAEAESAARAAIAAQPNSETWDALSQALLAQGKGKEALAAADEALKLDWHSLNAANSRGAALLVMNRPQEALQAFEALASQGVEAPVLALNRAAAYEMLGRHEEARAIYDAAEQRWPHLPNLQQQIAARRR